MHLSLIRRGGFAGLRPPPFVVDLAAQPTAAAERLSQLLAAAKADLPRLAPCEPQPDRFVYVLTVGRDDGSEEKLEFAEVSASPAIASLIAAIQSSARHQSIA